MGKRRLYSESLRQVLSNATEEIMLGRVVAPGYIRFVTHAAVEDSTTAPTTLAFGRQQGGRFEALEEDPAPQAGIRYHTEKTHHFLAGECPAFRVEGGTSNDVLRGFLEGYEEVSE